MKKLNKVISASLLSLLVAIPMVFGGIADCQIRIDMVQLDLDLIDADEGIGGKNAGRTYDGLTSKLMGADRKLDQAKVFEAITKLIEFRDKVNTLAGDRKPKLSWEDAETLLNGDGGDDDMGVNGAIDCICQLIDELDQPEACFE